MRKTHTCGVYRIVNTLRNKAYVGSSVTIEKRFYKHKALLRANKHINKKLQASWNLHGESSFKFEILEVVEDTSKLVAAETYWADTLDTFNNGYNLRVIAESNLGFKHSEEAKKKISESGLGRVMSEMNRKLVSERVKANPITMTEEQRGKLSATHKENAKILGKDYYGTKNLDRTGTKQSPEQIAKRVIATALTKARNKEKKDE